MSEALRLFQYPVTGKNNISQNQFSAVRLEAVCFVLLRRIKICRGFKGDVGEGEHVRFPVNISVFPVVKPYAFIIGNEDIHFRFIWAAFLFQHLQDNLPGNLFGVEGKDIVGFIFYKYGHLANLPFPFLRALSFVSLCGFVRSLESSRFS